MSELNRKQHEDLAGGYSAAPFFGGFMSTLRGLFNPAVDANDAPVDANHHLDSIINNLDSIARQLTPVPAIYIYKDSTDASTQFSVKAGSIEIGGVTYTYAGAVNIAGLVAGATRYIWLLPSASAATLSVAVGTAYPDEDTAHFKLGAIAQPASGTWLPTHFTPALNQHALQPTKGRPIRVAFNKDSSSPIPVGIVPKGARIVRCTIYVDTAWNGTAPTIKVGDAGDDDRLMANADNNLKAAIEYESRPGYKYTAQTAIVAAFVNDSSTAGAGEIVLEYI